MKTRLRQLREAEGISQTALADILEVSRQTIISLESGKYKASLVLAHKIAQYFDKTIEDIFIFDLEEENL